MVAQGRSAFVISAKQKRTRGSTSHLCTTVDVRGRDSKYGQKIISSAVCSAEERCNVRQ